MKHVAYLTLDHERGLMIGARYSFPPFCCEQVILEKIQPYDDPQAITAIFLGNITRWRMDHPDMDILIPVETLSHGWSLYFCRYVYYKRTLDSFGNEALHRIASLCGPLDDRFVLEPMDDQMFLVDFSEESVRASLLKHPPDEAIRSSIPRNREWNWKEATILLHLYFRRAYDEINDEFHRPILFF